MSDSKKRSRESSPALDEPDAKAARTDDSQDDEPASRANEFHIVITNPSSFRSIVEIMSNSLDVATFTVIKTDSFQGITADEVHDDVIMANARLECEVKECVKNPSPGEQNVFTVSLTLLKTVLSISPANRVLEIKRVLGDAKIKLMIYEPHMPEQQRVAAEVDTVFLPDRELYQFEPFDEKYTVEIDIQAMRSILSVHQKIHADSVKFRIIEPKNPGPKRVTIFAINACGDGIQILHSFQSVTDWQVNSTDPQNEKVVIKASEDDPQLLTASALKASNMAVKYSHMFSTRYLNNFFKGIDKQPLKMMMSNDKPLVVWYDLGVDKSYVRLILSPKIEEEPGAE